MEKEITFGQYFKNKRLKLNKSLRDIAIENNIDALLLSKIERDIELPSDEVLRKFSKILKLKNGSDEFKEFLDLSSKFVKRKINIMDQMPILFRTEEGTGIPKSKIKEFIKSIEKCW